MLLIRLVAQQPHLQKERNVHCLLVLNPFNSKSAAWKQVVVTVVNDTSPLLVLTLVTLETVWSWLPQVLLGELEVGVHKSLRVGSAAALCCLPGVNSKPSSRHVTVQCMEWLQTAAASQLLLRSRPVLVSVPCERKCSWV